MNKVKLEGIISAENFEQWNEKFTISAENLKMRIVFEGEEQIENVEFPTEASIEGYLFSLDNEPAIMVKKIFYKGNVA